MVLLGFIGKPMIWNNRNNFDKCSRKFDILIDRLANVYTK